MAWSLALLAFALLAPFPDPLDGREWKQARRPALTFSSVIRSMLIRMTGFGTITTALLAASMAAGGVLAGDTGGPESRTALVIDAASARDGRELVDDRLVAADAEVRLPRTEQEALTNVRYFARHGYGVVVAGPDARAAAEAAGVDVVSAPGLPGALAAARR